MNYILALVIALAGFGSGWVSNGWRLGEKAQTMEAAHAQERADQAETFNKRRSAMDKERDALADKLAAADTTFTKQLAKARYENTTLASRLATGSVGLRIDATCPSAGTGQAQRAQGGGMDSGASAVLSATAGQAYLDLRDNIATTEATLSACQSSLRLFQ